MKVNAHIIEKVFVEVNTGNMTTATAVRDNIAGLFEQRIFPKLEKILEEWNQAEKVVRFPTFSLDVQISADNLADRLETAVTSRFSQEIRSALSSRDGVLNDITVPHDVEIIPVEKNREEQFFFFLEKGHLPWFGTKAGLMEFMQLHQWKESLERPEFLNRLIHLLKKGSGMSDRFIFQLEEKQKMLFLKKINPAIEKAADEVHLMQMVPAEAQAPFFRFLLAVSLGSETASLQHSSRQLATALERTAGLRTEKPVSTWRPVLIGIMQKSDLLSGQEKDKIAAIIAGPSETGKANSVDGKEERNRDEFTEIQETGQDSFFAPEEKGIAVQNAGLFLLHPFLKSFFNAIEVLDERGQIKESARHMAVQALHYLATGYCDFFEADLLFEKFLCGVSLTMPVERESLLSEHTMEESGQLLREVIRLWPALKNSSPDGLRQLFIQRNGKLMQEEHHYTLLMERKAQDILLDKLSWNSSMAKIPWRKGLLYVEW